MPRVLFLVHGMGEHNPTWSGKVKDKLNEVALRYPRFRKQYPSGDVTDILDVVEISYDRCFSQHVNEWNESVSALEQFVDVNEVHAGRALEDFSRVVDWVSRSAKPTETHFFWSHAVDVLLYRFFPLVADEVRVTVMSQMADRLARRNVRASVLAHSLGTRVALDCLQLLGTVPFGGGESLLARNGYFFDSVFMLANVSLLLGRVRDGDPDPYLGIVHPRSTPHSAGAGPGYCSGFYNFRHARDPFTLVKPFRPTKWGSDYYTPEKDLDHIAADWNVHGFTHFLDHPAVHVPILNALLAKQELIVTAEELPAIVNNFKVPSLPPCQQAVQNFLRKVDRISDDIRLADGDLSSYIIGIAQFYAAVEEAKNECK